MTGATGRTWGSDPPALGGPSPVDSKVDPWTAAMRRGDYATAWSIAAAEQARRDPARRDDHDLPYHLRWVWDGRPFDGGDVLVRCYHGLGDTVQFARYLPLLRQRAASVTVEMQPRLLPLFRDHPGIDRLVPFDVAAPVPPLDCDLEIMELAFALRIPPDAAPPVLPPVPPAHLPPGCIALCWRGGDWDPDRSIPEPLMRPLARGPAVSLVAAPTELPVINPQGCPMDMMQTAALISGAALVITVDTLVAHLAGSLNRPTWLLVKHDPDWRWPVEGMRTSWYPSMRVFRQDHPGDWPGVIARVTNALDRQAGAPRSRAPA